MAHQHYVPQLILRRLARDDQMLWELRKDQLRIGSKNRHAKGIMYCVDGFTDILGDDLNALFDRRDNGLGKLLQRVEESNDCVYEGTGAEVGELLLWVITVYVRSPLFTALADSTLPQKGLPPLERKLALNRWRATLTQQIFDQYRQPAICLAVFDSPASFSIPLADNAVIPQYRGDSDEPIFTFPLGRSRMAALGPRRELDRIKALKMRHLLVATFAFADLRVVSADKSTLEAILEEIETRSGGYYTHDFIEAAKRPHADALTRYYSGLTPLNPCFLEWS